MSKELGLSGQAAIVFDAGNKLVAFAAEEIKKTMESIGLTVSFYGFNDFMRIDLMNRIYLLTLGTAETGLLLEQKEIAPFSSLEPQGYSIRKKIYNTHIEWYVSGFDEYGTMTGGLDLAQIAKTGGLDAIKECDKVPFIKERGIKFNIPLDARTPSYSDSGDSAQANIENMWDMGFWMEFLDEMARNHFNVLSLWNLHPFPSMVYVPEYPEVALSDVMRTTIPLAADLEGRGMSTPESLNNLITLKVMTIQDKINFWQDVMQYAKDRGVDIYIITWNTFVYGTESSGYGFTTSIEDVKTQDYFRKSVRTLINTYPLLKGIGITAGENMSRNADQDEAWLYNTYGEGINDALALDENRTLRLIHRIQYANIRKALEAFSSLNPRCTIDTSFKYSQAHMYSSVKPYYIHENDDGYLKDIEDHKTWLTVRDDDYYMFRGGCDSEFVRAYIKNMPREKLRGFYLGPDGYTWGREYISRTPESPRQLVMKKRWFSFLLWGSIAYDPELPEEYFINILGNHFPEVNSNNLYKAWAKASQIIPLVNRLHNSDCQLDFQWYPEACVGRSGYHDINRFIKTKPQKGEGIIGIPEYVEGAINNTKTSETTPVEIALKLWDTAREALLLVKDMPVSVSSGLRQTEGDIEALSLLGMYYSKKILGATNVYFASLVPEPEKSQYSSAATQNLKEASDYWRQYAAKVDSLYIPQVLTRLIPEGYATLGLNRDISIPGLQIEVEKEANTLKY